MALRGSLAVVTDGQRQEVILDVGVIHRIGGPDKSAAFELVGRAKPGLLQQPFHADPAFAQQVIVCIKRDRFQRLVLHIDFKMVLQVRTDPRPVGQGRDAVLAQVVGRPDARQHEEFRRVDRTGRNDHLSFGADCLDPALPFDFNAMGALVLKQDTAGKGADQGQAARLQRRPQIGVGGGPAAALPDGGLHRAEAFLLFAVVIGGIGPTGLLAGLDKGVEQGVLALAPCHVQRAVGAAKGGSAAVPGFHPLEIGQHVGVGPACRAAVAPVVVILAVAAHEDHAVDGRRPAQHLAARRGKLAPAQMRLGLSRESPVVSRHVHRV